MDKKKTIGMCWDTTANNTGVHEGAARHFEVCMEHAILWCPCRRHMIELHIKHAYEALFGGTQGKDNTLFKRFKEWYLQKLHEDDQFPDPAGFKKWRWPRPTSQKNRQLIAWATETREKTTEWLTEGTFPREDYREKVELTHFILGGDPIRRRGDGVVDYFKMRRPGPIHHARFMARSITCMKMYILSDIFPLSQEEKSNLNRIVLLLITLYNVHFLSCPLATSAPRNDLNFIYKLRIYRTVDAVVADAALASCYRHLMYVVPEMVVLALFDDDVPNQEQAAMSNALRACPRPNVLPPGKPGQPSFTPQIRKLTDAKPCLSEFITEKSWLLFHLIDADTQWLSEPVETWHQIPAYLDQRDFCRHIEVVNDCAERAIKDCQQFAKKSASPEHRDCMITVAGDHRGRASTITRKDGLNNMARR